MPAIALHPVMPDYAKFSQQTACPSTGRTCGTELGRLPSAIGSERCASKHAQGRQWQNFVTGFDCLVELGGKRGLS
jgi:hypothetical protein